MKYYYVTILQILGPIVALWAILTYSPLWLIATVVMFFLMKCVGITIGYHRICAHNTHLPNDYVKAVITALGFYGSNVTPIEFCGQHHMHHKYEGTDKDPHNYTKDRWKTLFPILWNRSKIDRDVLTRLIGLRRSAITNVYDKHYWKLIALPYTLLFLFPPVFLFVYFIPMVMSTWAGTYATFNHNENGAIDRGWIYGIVTMGEHKHKWHHDNPFDTSGEGWLDVVINLIAKKRVTQ